MRRSWMIIKIILADKILTAIATSFGSPGESVTILCCLVISPSRQPLAHFPVCDQIETFVLVSFFHLGKPDMLLHLQLE